MHASFRGYLTDITVIGAYEPAIDLREEKMEAFYKVVEKIWDETPKDNIKFLIGILNAKRTWARADGVYNNMIDFLMEGRKWKSSVKECRSFPNADIDSDHQLTM
jgi:hypothetical protein